MNTENTICVNLLGGTAITYGDKVIDGNNLRSKKIWSLLSFLVVFRNKDISQNDLIELIYSEDKSSNPMNALKTLMHRVRSVLEELEYMGGKQLILQHSGSYQWNSSIEIILDTDVFEDLCNRAVAAGVGNEEALSLSLQAIDVYKGDFLPKFSMESWVIPLHTYYRTRYMRLVHNTVEMLIGLGNQSEIVEVCRKAIAIDPYDEYLYYNLMLALVNLDQTQAALTQYENTTKLFYKEFGVTPSEELKALYKQIVKSSQDVEMDINVVKERLREDDDVSGAFFCEYEFFKDIYRLEVRASERTGKPVHICLLSVVTRGKDDVSAKSLNTAMDKLIICVQQTLRKGDTFARYSVSQLVIMLPLTTDENAENVLIRIIKKFKAEHSRTPIELSYSFQPIDSAV